jgi:hypothetical protein
MNAIRAAQRFDPTQVMKAWIRDAVGLLAICVIPANAGVDPDNRQMSSHIFPGDASQI